MTGPDPSRRRLLERTAGTLAIAALAGCRDLGWDIDSSDVNRTDKNDGGDVTDGDDLPLREANVVEVSVNDGDAYAFDVALHHDDGEDGYTNWWQVERLNGTLLGWRDLTPPLRTAVHSFRVR